MSNYWAENHDASKSTMICLVKILSSMGILLEVEILKIFYISGNFVKGRWKEGMETNISDDYVLNEKELLDFVFKDIKY